MSFALVVCHVSIQLHTSYFVIYRYSLAFFSLFNQYQTRLISDEWIPNFLRVLQFSSIIVCHNRPHFFYRLAHPGPTTCCKFVVYHIVWNGKIKSHIGEVAFQLRRAAKTSYRLPLSLPFIYKYSFSISPPGGVVTINFTSSQ